MKKATVIPVVIGAIGYNNAYKNASKVTWKEMRIDVILHVGTNSGF